MIKLLERVTLGVREEGRGKIKILSEYPSIIV